MRKGPSLGRASEIRSACARARESKRSKAAEIIAREPFIAIKNEIERARGIRISRHSRKMILSCGRRRGDSLSCDIYLHNFRGRQLTGPPGLMNFSESKLVVGDLHTRVCVHTFGSLSIHYAIFGLFIARSNFSAVEARCGLSVYVCVYIRAIYLPEICVIVRANACDINCFR